MVEVQVVEVKDGSVLSGVIWMLVISLLLFWLPVIGPLLAGIVGGKKAGGVGKALLAVFLPGIILAVALFMLASMMTGLPVIGALAGLGGIVFALLGIGPMLIGAIIGGALA
ncbi:MAG: hypothetical protein O2780_01655 [Proteobacteria bacterium]|jgi:hypothetical protein|nr:hypothetical protein [Pseudomonadota bacterium]MDA1299551.1 hypothetical protein [Pseudomonadota bacterium]